jgi:DNA-directed RNA polymerase subunit M/transcription elongation factor TFIIS
MNKLENNIPVMTDDQRRAWTLINALRPELRSRVVRDLQTIDSVEAVVTYVGRNESTSIEKSSSRRGRDTQASDPELGGENSLPTRKRADHRRGFRSRGRGPRAEGDKTHTTRSQDTAAAKPKFACFKCGKEGHKSAYYPDRKEPKNE